MRTRRAWALSLPLHSRPALSLAQHSRPPQLACSGGILGSLGPVWRGPYSRFCGQEGRWSEAWRGVDDDDVESGGPM